ncbi:MAG: hypothetical protein WCG48_02225 [Candidatus Berkelbacteria bacterium]
MTLNDFFQVSVSVFCIVATVFMIMTFIWIVMLRSKLNKLIDKLEEISETARSTTGEIKQFVERIIQSLDDFRQSVFTLGFVSKIVNQVIGLISNNSKGKKDGQAK